SMGLPARCASSGPITVAAGRGRGAPEIHSHAAEHDEVEGLRGRVPELEGLFSLIDLLSSRTRTVDRPVQGAQLRLQTVPAHQAQRENPQQWPERQTLQRL